MTGPKSGAVIFHLLAMPADPDAKQKPAPRKIVERGDGIGRVDGIALIHETDAGADLERACRQGGGGQRNERVHHVAQHL
jgi:hypothetical protein